MKATGNAGIRGGARELASFAQKRQVSEKPTCLKGMVPSVCLDVRLGLADADDALAFFPLAALFENGDAFETLQDITFDDDAFGTLETVVLGHGGKCGDG
jgi:hypothetical protein